MDEERYERKRLYAGNNALQAEEFSDVFINDLPQKKTNSEEQKKLTVYTRPFSVEDTFTAREIKEMRAAKKANCVYIALVAITVALGVVAIIRFSSIFEISKSARLLNKETAKITKTIVLDRTALDAEKLTYDADKIANDLGLQKPQKYQIEKVKINPSDMTVIHHAESGSQKSNAPWYERIADGIRLFFGKIDLK